MRLVALLPLLVCLPLWAGPNGQEPSGQEPAEQDPTGQEPLRVAVAANFRPTLEAISAEFEAATGTPVALSSASTGVLASQVLHGAPFDLFLAADREAPQRVVEQSAVADAATFCYAVGSLVLAGAEAGSADALAALARPDLSLAIANPATAPYGRAAMEVLARPEFAAASSRKLVRGNNVVQAYQFWHSGAVDLALVPASLAPTNAAPVPTDWHQPLEQHGVVLSPAAESFANWLRGERGRALVTRDRYLPCP